jgi:hypothetical protein
MKICGIDISSAVCGWNIYDIETNTFQTYGYYVFKENTEPLDKVIEFKTNVIPLIQGADVFVLEDRLSGMSGGKTTANTLMLLAYMNACTEYILWSQFPDKSRFKVNVRSARKNAGLTIPHGEKAKYKCFEFIVANHPYIKIEYKKPTKKNPKTDNPKEVMFDITDSMILSLSVLKLKGL